MVKQQKPDNLPSTAAQKAVVKTSPTGVMMIASAALVLSVLALGLSGFLLLQQQGSKNLSALPVLSSGETGPNTVDDLRHLETRLNALAAKLDNRLGADAPSSPSLPNKANPDQAEIFQRIADLEAAITAMSAASPSPPASSPASSPASPTTLVSAGEYLGLFAASGLLADNVVGAPLDRWVTLLQRLQDQGAVMPDLGALVQAVKAAPVAPVALIRRANDLVPELAAALHKIEADDSFLHRTGAKLGQLVKLRNAGADAGGNDGVLQRFEIALSLGDLDSAITAARQWSGGINASGTGVSGLDEWIANAAARQELDQVVSAFVTNILDATSVSR